MKDKSQSIACHRAGIMGPIFLLLSCSIVVSFGEVYQLPPPGYLPPNHKYPDTLQHPTPTNLPQNLKTTDSSHLEPFATMEIFKERNQRHLQPNYQIIPDNHKPIHVEVYKPPQNQQFPEEAVVEGQEAQPSQTVDRGSDLETALRSLDFFNERSAPLKPVATISAPPSTSAQYATAFPQEVTEEIEGRPSRYYPVQQNNFSPQTDFYTPRFNHNANQKKLAEIIDKSSFQKKLKPKKKYSSKLQKFPKKYKSSYKSNKLRVKPTISELEDFSFNDGGFNSKLQARPKVPLSAKLQIKPVSEVEEFSVDSFKDKRRIPVRYHKAPRGESEGDFGAELNSYNSFPSHKGSSHADYSLPASGGSHTDYSLPASGGSHSDYSLPALGGSHSDYSLPASGGKHADFSLPASGGSHADYSLPASGGKHADFSLPTGGSSNGERVQFEMHGMDGPDSYKFGYDTGKGHNRHFRYEERDNHGKVKGHYGFYDQEGKMSMMHYEADPHTGFHAGPYHHPENHREYH